MCSTPRRCSHGGGPGAFVSPGNLAVSNLPASRGCCTAPQRTHLETTESRLPKALAKMNELCKRCTSDALGWVRSLRPCSWRQPPAEDEHSRRTRKENMNILGWVRSLGPRDGRHPPREGEHSSVTSRRHDILGWVRRLGPRSGGHPPEGCEYVGSVDNLSTYFDGVDPSALATGVPFSPRFISNCLRAFFSPTGRASTTTANMQMAMR